MFNLKLTPRKRKLAMSYLTAKDAVLDAGYEYEILWQESCDISKISKEIFINEYAWVVLSSGMKVTTIDKVFPLIVNSFQNWDSFNYIISNQKEIKDKALVHFNHPAKINAILSTIKLLENNSFSWILDNISKDPLTFLMTFPFIGPATSFHLAKNIGIPVAKPDRHLLRVAKKTGYSCVNTLCKDISEIVSDPIPVVDLIIWRYAVLTKNYLLNF